MMEADKKLISDFHEMNKPIDGVIQMEHQMENDRLTMVEFETRVLLNKMKEMGDKSKDLELRLAESESLANEKISELGRLKEQNENLTAENVEYSIVIQKREAEITYLKLKLQSKIQISAISSYPTLVKSEKVRRRKLRKNNKIYAKKNNKLKKQMRKLQVKVTHLKKSNSKKTQSEDEKMNAFKQLFEALQNEYYRLKQSLKQQYADGDTEVEKLREKLTLMKASKVSEVSSVSESEESGKLTEIAACSVSVEAVTDSDACKKQQMITNCSNDDLKKEAAKDDKSIKKKEQICRDLDSSDLATVSEHYERFFIRKAPSNSLLKCDN